MTGKQAQKVSCERAQKVREGSRAPTRHSGLRAASQGITAAKLASAAVSRRGLLPSTSIDGALVRACLHDLTTEISPKKTMSQAYMSRVLSRRRSRAKLLLPRGLAHPNIFCAKNSRRRQRRERREMNKNRGTEGQGLQAAVGLAGSRSQAVSLA